MKLPLSSLFLFFLKTKKNINLIKFIVYLWIERKWIGIARMDQYQVLQLNVINLVFLYVCITYGKSINIYSTPQITCLQLKNIKAADC